MKKKIIIILSIIVLISILYFIYLKLNNNKENKPKEEIVISKDKYLTANYALELYENTFSYVEENIDLNNLKKSETLIISSDKLIEEKEEYKYCEGFLNITKLENDIYEYVISSDCINAMKDSAKLNIKVYSNINQNSNYQIVTSLENINGEYIAGLSDYKLMPDSDGYSLELMGPIGIMHLNNNMNIKKIHVFDEIKQNINNDLIILDSGYLIKEYDSENEITNFYYYNPNYELVSKIESLSYMKYLYETEEELVFAFYNEILYYSKTDGTLKNSITLKIEGYDNEYIYYMNNILYSIIEEKDSEIMVIYDIEGNLLSKVDITKYNETISYVNNNYIGLYSFDNKNVSILNLKGEELKIIDLEEDLEFERMDLKDNTYSILYRMQDSNDSYKNYYVYETYNENKLTNKKTYDKDYGINTLKESGLTFNYEMNYNFLIDEKIIEVFYTPDNNGMEVFLIYD